MPLFVVCVCSFCILEPDRLFVKPKETQVNEQALPYAQKEN
jgi:heterodisulfide reductase subunit B